MATRIRTLLTVFSWGLALSMLSAGAQAQPPSVYVSGGSSIYKLSGTSLISILTVSGANFESLAGGPDNVDLDAAGNAAHPFLLYACDTARKQIVRFDPTATPPIRMTQTVYAGLIEPECGRFTATGDFFFTNKNGGGIYELIATVGESTVPVANIPFSATPVDATAIPVDSSATMTGRGITQKYQGDLLAVDFSGNEVLRAPYAPPPSFATLSPFTTSDLSGPVGIARISTGEVFVANSVLVKGQTTPSPVAHFDRSGNPAIACPGLTFRSNQIPMYLGTASVENSVNNVPTTTDTLYLVSSSNNAGTLWTWNTAQGNCNLISAATTQNPLSGVAVAPAPVTLALPVSSSMANPTPTTFNFNSNLFQLTATGCTATVTAYPMAPGAVKSMIASAGNSFPSGTLPAVNLGEDGYEIVYVAHWLNPAVNPPCTSVFGDHLFEQSFAGFVDNNSFTNPREVQCENSDPSTEPKLFPSAVTMCMAARAPLGVYPIGGPILGDQLFRNSVFALVNAGLSDVEPGSFCGFQSPLLNPSDPGYPASFSSASKNTLAVKFKLALTSGSCKNGPFISDASALISVAQIADSAGATVFNPINVNATASSLDQPPLFNAGNQQYSFTLTISGYAPGTYTLTVTFVTNNTTNQTILFTIK
jgi:hypothetical protein